jgi:hypothetical protein
VSKHKAALTFEIDDKEIDDVIIECGTYSSYWLWDIEKVDGGYVVVEYTDEGDPEGSRNRHNVETLDIVQAVAQIMDGEHVRDDIAGQVRQAVLDGGDLGMVDAVAADCILQVATFGGVKYG